MRYLKICSLLVAVALFGIGCGDSGPSGDMGVDPDSDRPQIAVIPKGTTHDFWRTIHAGALAASEAFDVDIIWMSGEREDDRRQQIEVVQNFIARGVDAIVLAPLDETALVRPVEQAEQRGIPVVVIDSGLQSDAYRSFVATDNLEGGRMGARRMGDLLNGEGKVILLRYSEGSASTAEREEGFLEVLEADYPDIEIISSNQYAGVTKETAYQASQNLLNRYGDEVDGIFCPNEPVTFGMLRALQNAGRAGDVFLIGFDTSETLLEAIEEGTVHGLVSQDPYNMGYQGVATAVDVLNGEEVSDRIATRLEIITDENMDDPDIQELINPDLSVTEAE